MPTPCGSDGEDEKTDREAVDVSSVKYTGGSCSCAWRLPRKKSACVNYTDTARIDELQVPIMYRDIFSPLAFRMLHLPSNDKIEPYKQVRSHHSDFGRPHEKLMSICQGLYTPDKITQAISVTYN
eukprot:scaffold34701_cov229-Amphora_coffeaeformis.AAC.8